MLLFDALEHFPSSSAFLATMTFFLFLFFFYLKINMFSTSPPSRSVSISLSSSSSSSWPISLCLSLCLSQPITGRLQVLNLRPRRQLTHYISALNLSVIPLFVSIYSSVTFLSVFSFFFAQTFLYELCFSSIFIS